MLGQEFHYISPLVVGSQQFTTALPTSNMVSCKSSSFSSIITVSRTEDTDVQGLFLAFIFSCCAVKECCCYQQFYSYYPESITMLTIILFIVLRTQEV